MTNKQKNWASIVIALAVVGGFYLWYFSTSATDGASTEAPPRPEYSAKLLSDQELAIDGRVTAGASDPRIVPIRSLVSDDFSDLRALDAVFAEKRFVFLGEASHGVAEFNWLKSRLIRYLHQIHGFEVIAFESPFMACAVADTEVGRVPPKRIMADCLHKVWQTTEVDPLFSYIAESRKGSSPLHLTGFDIQGVGTGSKLFSVEAKRLLTSIDAALGERLLEGERSLLQSKSPNFEQLLDTYSKAADVLSKNAQQLKAQFPSEARLIDIVTQEANSRHAFVRQLAAGGYSREANAIRDKAMADSFGRIADQIFPGKKIVVWAHDAHISKARTSSDVTSPMFSVLRPDIREKAISIGFYMGSGSAMMNNDQIYSIAEPGAGQLAMRLRAEGWRSALYDVRPVVGSEQRSTVNDWMNSELVYRSWGTQPVTIAPAAAFDALVYVDRVTPTQRTPAK